MLKNSQARRGEGCCVFCGSEQRTKGPEGVTFSGAEAGEREGTDFMPFVDGGYREEFFYSMGKATSGEGGDRLTGQREERQGFFFFLPFTQLKECAFLSPLFGPLDRAELQDNYGNVALKPGIALV